MAESELDRRIEDLFRASQNPKIAVLAHQMRVDVKIMAKASSAEAAAAMIAPLETELRARIGDAIFGADSETLEGALLRALGERGWTLGTAESITGGAVADAIVDAATLAQHGAVSEETALAMAHGARRRLGVDVAIATTGIAGPAGGSPEKPVGLVWFAVASPDGERTRRAVIPGDRDDVRRRAAAAALMLTWRHIAKAAG
jgi:nicotinamide-nucleotide amidase